MRVGQLRLVSVPLQQQMAVWLIWTIDGQQKNHRINISVSLSRTDSSLRQYLSFIKCSTQNNDQRPAVWSASGMFV